MRAATNSKIVLVFFISIFFLNNIAQLGANSKNLKIHFPSNLKEYFKNIIGNTFGNSRNCCNNIDVGELLDFRPIIKVHNHKPTSTPEISQSLSRKLSAERNVDKELPQLASILGTSTSCNISAYRTQIKIPHEKILDSKSTVQTVFPCRHYKRENPEKDVSIQMHKSDVGLPINLETSNNRFTERRKAFINCILGTGINEISTSLGSFNNKKLILRPQNHFSRSKNSIAATDIPGFQFHSSPKTPYTVVSNPSNGNNDQSNILKNNLVRMKPTNGKVMKNLVILRGKRGSRKDYYSSTDSTVNTIELLYTPSIYTHNKFSKQTQHEIQYGMSNFSTVSSVDIDSISKSKINQVSLANKRMQPSSRSFFDSSPEHAILPLNTSLHDTLSSTATPKEALAMAEDAQQNHTQTITNTAGDIAEINKTNKELDEIRTLSTNSFIMQTTQRWHKHTTKTHLHADSSDKVGTFKLRYPVKLWGTLGLYDDTYLNMINIHWLEFDVPSPTIHNIQAVLYGILMVIGCGGNILVIFMFVRCRSLRTPPNYLLANLAVSDFFMMAKTPIFILNSLYQGPVLGSLGCKIYGFVGGLTGTASIMTLTSIALDRYYVIVHPLNPVKRTTVTRALLMIAGVWIYAAIFSSLPLFGINNYTSEGYLTSCSFDYLSENFQSRLFVFIFFVAAWVIPLAIISFSYFHIFRIVRAAEKMETFTPGGIRHSGESFKCRHDKDKHRSEVKIALLASIIILLWILAWTPYALVALFGIFGNKHYITPLISTIPALFCKTASCVDPFIYSINHPKFQRELQSKFKLCFRHHHKRRQTSLQTSFYSTTFRGNHNSDSLTEMKQTRSVKSGKNFSLGKNVEVSPESNKTAVGYYVNEHPLPLLHKHPFSPVRINIIPSQNFDNTNNKNSDNLSEYVEIHNVEVKDKPSAIYTVAQSAVDSRIYVPNVHIEECVKRVFQSDQSQQFTKTSEMLMFETISEKVKSMQCLEKLLEKNIPSTKGNEMLRQRANSLPILCKEIENNSSYSRFNMEGGKDMEIVT